MDIYSYLFPTEIIAQIVILFQFVFFIFWLFYLFISQLAFLKKMSSELSNSEDINELSGLLRKRYLQNNETSEEMTMVSPKEADSKLKNFCKEKKVSENSPIYKHLRAIFFTGFNESQMNVETLIKNTTNRIVARQTTLRYLISLFIILGLLGTLAGLASSLYELSSILPGTEQLSDEDLKNGLKTLLGKLSGAFTPSLLGVIFTVLTMVVYTFLQNYGYRIIQRLEHQTLTNWIPNLIPTPSQRLLDKLYLSEKQMEKNFAAAEKVAEFAAQVGSETSELGTNIKNANSSLKDLTETAARLGEFTTTFTQNLDNFALNFKDSVDRLSPVTAGLTELYQKILDDSQKFQENVKQTLDDSQTFRSHVQEEFGQQSKQLETLFNSLKLYETAYLENRQSTDEKIQATLSAAEKALDNLSQQNELFVRELIETVGKPLREELKTELVNVTEALNQITNDSNTALGTLSQNIGSEIQSVATKLGNLHNPIEDAATFIEATSTGFESRTQNFLEKIRQEFQNNNQYIENGNINLEKLNNSIENLENFNGNIQKLTGEITNLTGKLGKLNQVAVGKPTIYRERKKANDNPQVHIYEPEPGVFKRLFNKIRRKKS